MRPIGWQHLFTDAQPVSFEPEPAPEHVTAIVIEEHIGRAHAFGDNGLGQDALTNITLVADTDALDGHACWQIIPQLLGVVPELAPRRHTDNGTPVVEVPRHGPTLLRDEQAVWRLGDRLEVCADVAGIHLGQPNKALGTTLQVTLDHAAIWWLACAMASARRWHEAIPRQCASCRVDLFRSGHDKTCGSEPRPAED